MNTNQKLRRVSRKSETDPRVLAAQCSRWRWLAVEAASAKGARVANAIADQYAERAARARRAQEATR
jgi:hypothetical protein